jgi:hypothetical protein
MDRVDRGGAVAYCVVNFGYVVHVMSRSRLITLNIEAGFGVIVKIAGVQRLVNDRENDANRTGKQKYSEIAATISNGKNSSSTTSEGNAFAAERLNHAF